MRRTVPAFMALVLLMSACGAGENSVDQGSVESNPVPEFAVASTTTSTIVAFPEAGSPVTTAPPPRTTGAAGSGDPSTGPGARAPSLQPEHIGSEDEPDHTLPTTIPPESVALPTIAPGVPSVPRLMSQYSDGWEPARGVGGGDPAYSTELGTAVVAFGPEIRFSTDLETWLESDADGRVIAEAGWMNRVIDVAGGFLGYGHTCEGNGDFDYEPVPCNQEPGLWFSEDGISWEMVSRGPAFEPCGPPDFSPEGVVLCYATVDSVHLHPSGTIYAYGNDGAGDAVWTSRDGRRWTRNELAAPEGCCSPASMPKGSLGDRMFGIETHEVYDSDCCPTDVFSVLYVSDDWQTFREIDTGEAFARAALDHFGVSQIASHDGVLVMIGEREFDPEGGNGVAAWATSDGETWTMTLLPSGGAAGSQASIHEAPDGFLVVSESLMWHSADGVAWQLIAFDTALDRHWTKDDIGFLPFTTADLVGDHGILTQGYLWRATTGGEVKAGEDGGPMGDDCG